MNKVRKNVRLVLNPYELGSLVWKQVNENLQEPVGALVNDGARVAEFVDRVGKLGFYKQYALRLWLKSQINSLENDVPDLLTGGEERHICKWKQIYTQHLKAIS